MKKSKFIVTAGGLLMAAALMISPAPVFHVQEVGASTLSSLAEQQEKVEQKIAALKKEKQALKNQSSKLQGELSWLNSKTSEEKAKYESLVDEMNAAYQEMEDALAEAAAAEKTVTEKQAQYKKRLQVMFENRNKSTMEMLFAAEDLKGFLANVQLISIIADNDKKVLDELIAAKDEAYLKRSSAEEYCAEMQKYVDKKNKEIAALKANLNKTQTEIENTKSELAQTEKDEKALLEESNKIAAQIKSLQSSSGYYGGAMTWPTPGYTGINPTNVFGMRLHPIYHTWRMHSGVDINAPFNAKIVAVADGKVIIAKTISGYNSSSGNNYGGSGYGNYIIVDHGGGVASLYGHCKLLKVKVGDNVKAGQWIGVVGSTGLSTGAHLHFEIRENGSPVNPIQKKYLGTK